MFGCSREEVFDLTHVHVKPMRDSGNFWNDYQTHRRLVDSLKPGESGKFIYVLIYINKC